MYSVCFHTTYECEVLKRKGIKPILLPQAQTLSSFHNCNQNSRQPVSALPTRQNTLPLPSLCHTLRGWTMTANAISFQHHFYASQEPQNLLEPPIFLHNKAEGSQWNCIIDHIPLITSPSLKKWYNLSVGGWTLHQNSFPPSFWCGWVGWRCGWTGW